MPEIITLDDAYDAKEAFLTRFRSLVREVFPEYPSTEMGFLALTMCQEAASLFSPYVWTDPEDQSRGTTS